jgi:hypothetical protein
MFTLALQLIAKYRPGVSGRAVLCLAMACELVRVQSLRLLSMEAKFAQS